MRMMAERHGLCSGNREPRIGDLHENWRPIRQKMTQLLGAVAWSENDILVKNDVINDILVRK